MKKVFFLLFFLPLISFAQEEEKPVDKHELGINFFSAKRFHERREDHYYFSVSPLVSFATGVYYKRHFGKNAWRASFDYSNKKIRDGSALIDAHRVHYLFSTRDNLGISIGYERALSPGKWQPFIFSDLLFNYEHMNGSTRLSVTETRNFSEEFFEYGIALGAGLRYRISPVLSLSLELSADGFIFVYQDVLNAGDKYSETYYHINPVNKLGLAMCF